MCGIAGIYGAISSVNRNAGLDNLSGKLAHRGPDGHGKYEDDTIGMAHTRLSIIDLSRNAFQPLYNEDESIVLVCNGEIYNYKEIRTELLAKGHSFRSDSDCEVILHLYEEYSDNPSRLLDRLTGMFAFAVWDLNKKKLFIARDRIGIKPLYYSYENGLLIFSSEVKPIAVSGCIQVNTDFTSVYEYFLTGSIPGPNTLYKEIKSLPPGYYLTIEDGRLNIREYWDIPYNGRKWKNLGEAEDKAGSLLSEIVKDHLVADVPVGTFLSAGVDSSLITAMAVEHQPGIHSFTASFPGEPEDEGIIAAKTAESLGTTHHAYELKSNFYADFDEQFRYLDQPFAINSALSLGRISNMARKHVKVVLSGDGADELFGGYYRHEFPKLPAFLKLIPGPLQNRILKAGARLTGKKSLEVLRKVLELPEGQKFLNRMAVTDTESILSLLAPDVAKEIDKDRYLLRLNGLFSSRQDDDQLNRLLYVEMKTTLVDEMLTKCDRMTMINGIEGRVPFLDHRFVNFAFSVPSEFKREGGTGKLLLRNLLAKRLGKTLAFREKTGFNSPLKQWLINDAETRNFTLANIDQAKRLPVFNSKQLQYYSENLDKIRAETIFGIVCMNTFDNNI